MRRARLFSITGTLLLGVLHNNWWSWKPDLTFVFGIIPFDLLYRVIWVLASTGVLWLMIRGWWRTSE